MLPRKALTDKQGYKLVQKMQFYEKGREVLSSVWCKALERVAWFPVFSVNQGKRERFLAKGKVFSAWVEVGSAEFT